MGRELMKVAVGIAVALLLATAAAVAFGQPAPAPPTCWRVVKSFAIKQCNGRSCRILAYTWRERSDDPRRHYLYLGDAQVGAWDYDERYWRPCTADGSAWGDASPVPPAEPPGAPAPAGVRPGAVPLVGQTEESPDGPAVNFGLQPHKVRPDGHYSTHRGDSHETEMRQMFQAAGDDLVDDSQLCHLAVFGAEAERVRVLRDLDGAAELGEFKGKLHVHGYDRDGWVARRRSVQTGAGLTFVVRTARGEELARWEGYEGALALRDRLKKIDPSPGRKPDPPPGPLDGLRDFSALTAWIRGHGGQIVAVVLVALAARSIVRANKPK